MSVPSITKQGWDVKVWPETIRHYNSGKILWKKEPLYCTRLLRSDQPRCGLEWRKIVNGELKSLGLIDIKQTRGHEEFEDGRLFLHNRRLYMAYTEGIYGWNDFLSVQKLALLNNDLTIQKIYEILYAGNGKGKSEKNWQFFSEGGKMYFVYSIDPHVVVELDKDMKPVAEHCSTPTIHWQWGTMRGGTPPIKIIDPNYGSVYCSFFHGHVAHPVRHRRYNMSAYLFSPVAPFEIVAITKPLVFASEDDPILPNKTNRLWEPLVVFPSGAILEDRTWNVSCGINDSYDADIKFPHDDLKFFPVAKWEQGWSRYFRTINASLPVKSSQGFIEWLVIPSIRPHPPHGVMATSVADVAEAASGRPGVEEIEEETYNQLIYGSAVRPSPRFAI